MSSTYNGCRTYLGNHVHHGFCGFIGPRHDKVALILQAERHVGRRRWRQRSVGAPCGSRNRVTSPAVDKCLHESLAFCIAGAVVGCPAVRAPSQRFCSWPRLFRPQVPRGAQPLHHMGVAGLARVPCHDTTSSAHGVPRCEFHGSRMKSVASVRCTRIGDFAKAMKFHLTPMHPCKRVNSVVGAGSRGNCNRRVLGAQHLIHVKRNSILVGVFAELTEVHASQSIRDLYPKNVFVQGKLPQTNTNWCGCLSDEF